MNGCRATKHGVCRRVGSALGPKLGEAALLGFFDVVIVADCWSTHRFSPIWLSKLFTRRKTKGYTMSPSERLSLRRGDYTGFHTYLCALCALCVKNLQLFNLSTFQLLNLDADHGLSAGRLREFHRDVGADAIL